MYPSRVFTPDVRHKIKIHWCFYFKTLSIRLRRRQTGVQIRSSSSDCRLFFSALMLMKLSLKSRQVEMINSLALKLFATTCWFRINEGETITLFFKFLTTYFLDSSCFQKPVRLFKISVERDVILGEEGEFHLIERKLKQKMIN